MRRPANPNHLKVDSKWGQVRAWSRDVMTLLGLRPGGHLPPEGMAPRSVQGITIWVTPEPMIRTFDRAAGIPIRKSPKHRVMARCPCCSREMSLGRLAQHVCKS